MGGASRARRCARVGREWLRDPSREVRAGRPGVLSGWGQAEEGLRGLTMGTYRQVVVPIGLHLGSIKSCNRV
jgi:hypothetical protein